MTTMKEKCGELGAAIADGNINLAKILLNRGADPNEKGPAFNDVGTVLHLALLYEENEIVELLAEKGANLDALANTGQTPLMFAIRYNNDRAVAFFIEKRVALDIKDNAGYTALDLAKFNNRRNAVEMLTSAIKQQTEEKTAQAKIADYHNIASTRQSALKRLRLKVTPRP